MENNTQEKLLALATERFATKGFAGVSVRELTSAAQANVSAVSYYFQSKEGLYQAALKTQLSPILEALQLAKNQHELSPVDRLKFYASQIAAIHARSPFLARLIINEVSIPTTYGGPVIAAHLTQAYQFLQQALQDGIASGEFRADLQIDYATIALAGILNFYFLTRPLSEKFIPLPAKAPKEYTIVAFNIYLHGIMSAAENPSEKEVSL